MRNLKNQIQYLEFREEEPWESSHGPATIQPSQHTHIPNRHTQGNAIRNGGQNGIGNGVPNGYGNGIPNIYGNGAPNGYSNRAPNSYGNSVPNGYGNVVPDGYGNGVPNANGNEGRKDYDNGGFQNDKPKSFKERIKETKDSKVR